MWVKICANTNLADAQLATDLGADAVGFVFAPSKRQVTVAEVAEITRSLPDGIERVGVFPDWTAARVIAAVRDAGLTAVQLHAEMNLTLLEELREGLESHVRVIQAVPWAVADDGISEARVAETLLAIEQSGLVDRVLVDSKVGAVIGGTGTAFDWSAAQGVFESSRASNLILAGGLTPDNVGAAIRQLKPWGVDVASGVEAVPGKKDADKLARFIRLSRE